LPNEGGGTREARGNGFATLMGSNVNRSTTPSTPRWERAAWWAGCALIGLAVFSGFFYVHSFGVNLYRWDEWDVLPALFQRYFEGEWSASDFWELHNEHRIVFPKLILFGLGLPSRGNTLPNMYATEVLLTCILAWFLAAVHRQCPRDWMIWLMVPAAFLVFSLRQHENMLRGFQVGFELVAAAAQCTCF